MTARSSRDSSAQLVWLWLCKSGVFGEAAATLCTVSKRLLLLCLSAWIYNQRQIWCYVHLLNLLYRAGRLLTYCLRAKLLFVHVFACHFVDVWMRNSASKAGLASRMVKCLANLLWVKFLSSGCPTLMFLFLLNARYLVTDDKNVSYKSCKTFGYNQMIEHLHDCVPGGVSILSSLFSGSHTITTCSVIRCSFRRRRREEMTYFRERRTLRKGT